MSMLSSHQEPYQALRDFSAAELATQYARLRARPYRVGRLIESTEAVPAWICGTDHPVARDRRALVLDRCRAVSVPDRRAGAVHHGRSALRRQSDAVSLYQPVHPPRTASRGRRAYRPLPERLRARRVGARCDSPLVQRLARLNAVHVLRGETFRRPRALYRYHQPATAPAERAINELMRRESLPGDLHSRGYLRFLGVCGPQPPALQACGLRVTTQVAMAFPCLRLTALHPNSRMCRGPLSC